MVSYDDPRWYTRHVVKRPPRRSRFFSLAAPLSRALFIALLLSAFAVVGLVVVRIPRWLAASGAIHEPKERLTAELMILQFLAQALGGSFVLVGLYLTWRSLRLSTESQVTDRFNKAVDHLGDDRIEIRLGGIFALARIAKDSPTDQRAIYEILSAYVREKSTNVVSSPKLPAADIQAAMTVLAQRPMGDQSKDQILSFARACLRGADLTGGQFSKASFEEADLTEAQLRVADLRGANFAGAKLPSAYLREADVRFANFTSADLSNASLRGCNFEGVLLAGASLNETSLIDADLSGAKYLTKGQLAQSVVTNTRLPSFD